MSKSSRGEAQDVLVRVFRHGVYPQGIIPSSRPRYLYRCGLYHLNNSGRAKATIWWNAWCSERREGKTSKSMRMFLLVDIASEFARRGDAVHVVAPQEAAR